MQHKLQAQTGSGGCLLQHSGPHHLSYFESAMTLFSEPVRGGECVLGYKPFIVFQPSRIRSSCPEIKKCTKLLFMRSRSVKDRKRKGFPRNMVGFSDWASSTYAQDDVATCDSLEIPQPWHCVRPQ